jgi:hypothetical protein
VTAHVHDVRIAIPEGGNLALTIGEIFADVVDFLDLPVERAVLRRVERKRRPGPELIR